MAAKKTSLTEQSLYLIAGRSLAVLLHLANPIILVRLFPKDEYGLYRQLLLIATTLLPIGQMGVTQGLYYFLPREPEKKDAVITQTLLFLTGVSIAVFAGLLLSKPWIARMFHSADMLRYIPVVSVYIFFMLCSSFFETSLVAERRAQWASVFIVVSQLVESLAVIIAALSSRSILVILYALVLFSCFRCSVQAWYLKNNYTLSLKKCDFSFFRVQLAYSIPLGFSNVAWMLQKRLHNFFVSFFFDPITFAVYSVGAFQLPLLNIIAGSVSNVIRTEQALLHKEGKEAAILRTWNSSIRKQNLIFFPVFVFFMFMAYEFITALFTADYAASVPIFRISLLVIPITGITPSNILSAYAATRYLMKISFFRLAITLAVLYACTKTWGLPGAISTNFIMELLFKSVLLKKTATVMRLPWSHMIQWRINCRILLASLGAGLPLLVLKQYLHLHPAAKLCIAAPLFVLLYGLFSKVFRTMDADEWRSLQSAVQNALVRCKKLLGAG